MGHTLMQGVWLGLGQLHVQLGRPLLKSMVSNLLLFLSRPLGITARTRLWNEGRCPVSERVSHVGRNSPQCKLVRAPSDPCGHLLFRLGVHSLPPMERVGSVRASATVKGPPLATKEKKSSATWVQAPVALLRVPPRRLWAASSGPWGMAVELSKHGKRSFL